MSNKPEITGYICRVAITRKQYDRLEENNTEEYYLDVVCPTLEALGAWDIEYNGHFGLWVFFNCKPGQEQIIATEIIKLAEKPA